MFSVHIVIHRKRERERERLITKFAVTYYFHGHRLFKIKSVENLIFSYIEEINFKIGEVSSNGFP